MQAALPRTSAGLPTPAVPTAPSLLADRRVLETRLMLAFRDSGSEQAFEDLYLEARTSLLAWIQRLCSTRQVRTDPAELLQDTFVNIYRYARTFRTGSGQTFRAWARTIAANVVRRSQRTLAIQAQALPSGLGEPLDESAGPAEHASCEEERKRLAGAWTLLLLHYAAAADRLSPRDRQALELIEIDGLTYAEAGRRLKVGPSNMKMIMFRTRKRIRRQMAIGMGLEGKVPDLRAAG